MLKPEDLKNKKFNKSMRGYDTAEVDKFLDEVRQEVRRAVNSEQ